MEDFTPKQIKIRYQNSIQPRGFRRDFSQEEDALLIALHQKFGPRWFKMKDYFKRKSGKAISERYLNVLRPEIKVGPWSLEEDKLLIATIRKYGYGQWSKICKDLTGRTDHACLRRAKHLLKWSCDFHSERGTGEYDPGEYDPELFAKILRPLPHKRYLNKIPEKKQKPQRTNGLTMLLKGLKEIAPEYAAKIEDVNSIDVSWMSPQMLHVLSDLFHDWLLEKDQERETKCPVLYIHRHPIRKRAASESDHDDDYCPTLEKNVPPEEYHLTQSALKNLLDMQADIMMEPKRGKAPNYNSRELAEMSLYTDYLSKHFHCKASCDKEVKKEEDDEEEEEGFDESFYVESLKHVTTYFIQPPVSDQQAIILAPNVTTMTGMEALQATENSLLSMSKWVSHSKPYIDFLCERLNTSPTCLQCSHTSSALTPTTTADSIMSEMTKSSFFVDERLKMAASVEGASSGLSSCCACKALDQSRRSVQLLRKRFFSLFTWPALLSQVGFSDKQEEEILRKQHNTFHDYFFYMGYLPENIQHKRKKERNPEKLPVKKIKTEEFKSEVIQP